ncbi:MAG: PilZ domain-containing protein [Terriglobia bacterium]
MENQAERRQHPRVTLDQQLEFLMGAIKGQGRLTDLSVGGVGLESPQPPLTLGSKARVSFMVGGKQIETDALVTRRAGSKKIGLEFVELAPHERFGLEEFIRYHQQQTQPPGES